MTFKATLKWRKSACYACVAESIRPVFQPARMILVCIWKVKDLISRLSVFVNSECEWRCRRLIEKSSHCYSIKSRRIVATADELRMQIANEEGRRKDRKRRENKPEFVKSPLMWSHLYEFLSLTAVKRFTLQKVLIYKSRSSSYTHVAPCVCLSFLRPAKSETLFCCCEISRVPKTTTQQKSYEFD